MKPGCVFTGKASEWRSRRLAGEQTSLLWPWLAVPRGLRLYVARRDCELPDWKLLVGISVCKPAQLASMRRLRACVLPQNPFLAEFFFFASARRVYVEASPTQLGGFHRLLTTLLLSMYAPKGFLPMIQERSRIQIRLSACFFSSSP